MDFVINGRFLTQRITGVQRYAHEFVQALDAILDAEPQFGVTVMSPRLSNAPPVWRNIELQQIGCLTGHAWEQFELPWYSRGRPLFCPGNTAPAISLLGAQPVIVTVHDLSYKYFPEAYRLAFRLWYGFIIPLGLRHARSVITVSEAERQAILVHYPRSAPRLHAIANGGALAERSIDTNDSVATAGYVLYVGSLSKRKNFPRVLEAATRLARKRGLHFVFVGDVPKSLVSPLAQVPEDISSKITFVGALDEPATLISYYRNALCLLFPSLYESSGLPPIEAMACGCPVIASNIPALQERCGDAAVYCDPYDINDMIAAIEQVADDESLRSRMRILGQRRAANYDWKTCAFQTLDLIRRSVTSTTGSADAKYDA